jgi:sugar/nucleoside kinase (ribokinase family)
VTPTNQPRVLCVGLTTLDVIQSVEEPPGPNHKVVALDSVIAAGGPATNAAVAAAHLGAAVTLVTALSPGPIGDIIRSDLSACSVALHPVHTDDAPVVASILVSRGTGDRAIVSPTSAASGTTATTPSSTDLHALLDGVGAVHLDGYHPAVALPVAAAARKRGIPVVVDLGSYKAHSTEVLRACTMAVVSRDFAPPGVARNPEAVLAYLQAHGAEAVAVTLGADGVALPGLVLPVDPIRAVDTCGAGDFFHGALTYRIAALGWDLDRFVSDLQFASHVAGRSITSFGTRQWLGES